ncbi:MAG: trypsin-like peptidase domain-containing protein [Clostridia bacterium]|nr:trypsin-like peptidase domain-containing protein [Clostridia bacterium]
MSENDDLDLNLDSDLTINENGRASYPPVDTPVETPSESTAPQVSTYVVTETRRNHTDTYIGGNYVPRSTAVPAAGTTASAGANSAADSKRTRGRMSIPAVIALCLVCSLLSGLICLAGYKLLVLDKQKNGNTLIAGTAEPAATDTGLSGVGTSQTSVPGSDSQVSIVVDGVTSPATAVAAKVLPSVVGIEVKVTSTSYRYGTTVSGGEGSGVIFSDDGYIITNYHVISAVLTGAGETNPNATLNIFLYTDPDTAIPGVVIGYDQGADLAVVKIDKTGLTPIELGDSDKINVGDTAVAIGNPGGLQFLGSVSQGIISGLNRSIQIDTTYKSLKLIQTDAAINPGNSGGAPTDESGCLIGINSAKVSVEGYEGMGFAIPVNDVVRICTDIIKNGSVKTAYLGVELNSDYSAAYLERLGYPGGLLVSSVIADSPAAKAGIAADDIIVAFNGTEVREAEDLVALKNQCSAGDTVTIRIYRLTSSHFGHWSGSYYDVDVTLG